MSSWDEKEEEEEYDEEDDDDDDYDGGWCLRNLAKLFLSLLASKYSS